MSGQNLRDINELKQAVAGLTAKAKLPGDISLYAITEGANNRVFRVEVNGASALLKVYFYHPNDQRDRLKAEFSFCTLAWRHGIKSVPQPLACDHLQRLGLYEFIQGRKLRPQEITQEIVEQALKFYQEINSYKDLPEALALPRASEACFTLAEHLHCVERRLQNLRNIDDSPAINREARHFIHHELLEEWRRLSAEIHRRAQDLGLILEQEIDPGERCLSPSDFGFHNALIAPDGTLRFIDFEYAGWDDPAKLISDFFCQPQVPVPWDYYEMFAAALAADLVNPEMHLARFKLLVPLYQLKWCCILLNDFLPVGAERRRFAREGAAATEQKAAQLQKARYAFQRLSGIGEN